MRRRKRSRPVYYITYAFRDGAAAGCFPMRKPSARKMKEDGLSLDADLVFQEMQYDSKQLLTWEMDTRVRYGELLANRLNMRRTVRELVVPRLDRLEAALIELSDCVKRIEQGLNGSRPPR